MGKICLFCGSKNVIKKGLSHGRQRWLCKACGRLSSGRKADLGDRIRELYAGGKFCTKDIANLLGVSRSTVCRRLGALGNPPAGQAAPGKIVAMMDATYWGRDFEVVAARDAIPGKFV